MRSVCWVHFISESRNDKWNSAYLLKRVGGMYSAQTGRRIRRHSSFPVHETASGDDNAKSCTHHQSYAFRSNEGSSLAAI